jgi:hypothetical protein
MVLGGAAQAVVETTVEENCHFIYRIKDPFGFKWIVGSTQLLPVQVQQIFQGNEAPVGDISSLHLVYLIDHPRAREACQWYGDMMGAAVLFESSSTAGMVGNIAIIRRVYLRLGNGERRTVIEVQDSIRPRTE